MRRADELRVLYMTSVCDPSHTISASAFWWADALARRCARVDVVALDVGGRPRETLHLHSLYRSHRLSRLSVLPRFARLLWALVPTVDVIFCQYSSKFVLVAWPFAFLARKPLVLWWSHGHVDWRLRLATRMVHTVVTSSPDSLRLDTVKKRVIGHGIDVDHFSPGDLSDRVADSDEPRRPVRILSIGRITAIKDVRTIVRAAALLKKRGTAAFVVELVGGIGRSGDQDYLDKLHSLVQELRLDDIVRFTGPVPHTRAVEMLRQADVFVNAQAAGGVGRAWLEAMAVGLPTVLCTNAFDQVMDDEQRRLQRFREGDASDLANRLHDLIAIGCEARRDLGLRSRGLVMHDHSLSHLADALHGVLCEAARSMQPQGATPQ